VGGRGERERRGVSNLPEKKDGVRWGSKGGKKKKTEWLKLFAVLREPALVRPKGKMGGRDGSRARW